jgi:hypothetical protein
MIIQQGLAAIGIISIIFTIMTLIAVITGKFRFEKVESENDNDED